MYFDQRRVKLKILAISFFPSAVVLERESSESWWISTLFLACEIDGGAWNGFLRFSRKRTDLSKKKLHSVCILTNVYQSAKEERFWFFEPCHESAVLVDFCMDSLLRIQQRKCAFFHWFTLFPVSCDHICFWKFIDRPLKLKLGVIGA